MIEVAYAIPAELLPGRGEIEVTFRSGGKPTLRLFEIRTIRP